jgi:hypothetical protein
MTDNTCLPRFTAAAGTKLAEAYSLSTVIYILPQHKSLPKLILPLSISDKCNLYRLLTHALMLDQAFAHCPIFLTAALIKV